MSKTANHAISNEMKNAINIAENAKDKNEFKNEVPPTLKELEEGPVSPERLQLALIKIIKLYNDLARINNTIQANNAPKRPIYDQT